MNLKTSHGGKSIDFGFSLTWVFFLTLLLTSWVALGRWHDPTVTVAHPLLRLNRSFM